MNRSAPYEAILHILDHDPASYVAFGVYWYPLKRLMLDAGHKRWYLGTADDAPTRARIGSSIGRDPDLILRHAAHHFRAKCDAGERYLPGSTFPDDSDDTYLTHDPDFGPAAAL
jgi:hypothetical protein